MLTYCYVINCAYCLIPPHPPTRKVKHCLGGRCSEGVCVALILRPPKLIQSITIGNIKRLDITAHCSKLKKETSDLTLFLSKTSMQKLYK